MWHRTDVNIKKYYNVTGACPHFLFLLGMKSQIAGFWTFEVSREAMKPDLFNAESICTHELPNK